MNIDNRKLLKRAMAAMDFPDHTCSASRHVLMMADALARGETYPMLQEEPEHCAGSMLAVVAELWELRAGCKR